LILVDTSVWSLALRRNQPVESAHTAHFRQALADGDVVLTGVVLQELLQGLAPGPTKDRLVGELGKLSLIVPTRNDHVLAAEFFTVCRKQGVQFATVDALIAAICVERGLPLLTVDRDFAHAADWIGLTLWS